MDISRYVKAIRDHCPELRIKSADPILEGWGNVVLEVNEELIFRFLRRPAAGEQFRRELELLPHLARRLSMPIPRLDFASETDATTPFVRYKKIPGKALVRELLTPTHAPRYATDLGQFLTELHSFPTDLTSKLGVLCAGAETWRTGYEKFYERIRREVLPLLTADERSSVQSRFEAYLNEAANFDCRPVMTHADLGAEHILCDPVQGRITGIIDWGDTQIGDPALDFTGLYFDLGGDFTRQVLERYDGDVGETFWERVSFYAWLIPFYEVLYGLEIEDRERLSNGLKQLRLTL